MAKPLQFFKKTDLIVIGAILTVCLAVWGVYQIFYAGKGAKAEIYYGSKLVATVDLNKGEDREFSIPEEPHVILHLYRDGSIGFIASDCPDKVCVRTGLLRKVGQSAACLPNRVILKIVPIDERNKGDTDIVV